MAEARWQQRFDNYCKALLQLEEAVDLMASRELSNLEKQGVIQAFEFSYELGWNTLRACSRSRELEPGKAKMAEEAECTGST